MFRLLFVVTALLLVAPGESEQWWADRVTILQALGVLDPEGNPTARLDLAANAQVARLTAEEFDVERAKMVQACGKCHAPTFAREELAKGDARRKARSEARIKQ